MIKNPNVEILQQANDVLAELAPSGVYVGGCAAGLLITDAIAAHVSPDAASQARKKIVVTRLNEIAQQNNAGI